VGAVCGRLKLYNRLRKEYEESTYWTYETLLKLYEGKHGAVLGANGGLYAIRRALFAPLPPDTIVDDFVIPLRILEAGYQVRFDPEAAAYEETTEDYAREFARRARIGAGNFQSLSRLPGLLNPSRGFAAYAFWSHKVLRSWPTRRSPSDRGSISRSSWDSSASTRSPRSELARCRAAGCAGSRAQRGTSSP
jgi:cellulose synthase/poly-beta-1,6-N-acetylglucosamine synthase-like glycosyltransferase